MANETKRIEAIYHLALEKKNKKERSAYLDSACGDDSKLRASVEGLLQAHDKAGDFLEVPPFDSDVALDESPLSEAPGTTIGNYKLLEQIGEGGMAVVYMAEQEKPLHRKVALKIIKLGMDTKSVIARFEVERQALAVMEHPNIAKVLDAGTTETGRPYFVMELVRGVSISEYSDKNKLATKERLDLFVQVCNAVQHAHQKGIIHRDIKPSNVMVTLRDGKPVPKVIDFGIAKATSQKLTEKTMFTRYAQMIGTPAYMSPEQAEFSELDIDTRTDIYSLGVLLYELLTGATPFTEEQLREAGYIEMQRIIREEEPAKPSTKLSTMGEALTDVAEHRKTDPGLLTKLLRGDLDWIVMKSLEKDRTRRYDTAVELSADITRHLNSEPVLAAAPSPLYKAHKFIRRHRIGVMAGLLVAAALLIGVIGTTIGLIEANSQRKLAKAQYRIAEENLQLVLETLDSTLLKKDLGSELGLRKVFGKLAELSAKFPNLPDYRRDLITCYVELASSLKSEGFEESYQKVLSVVESMQTETNYVPEYREPLALLHSDFGLVMSTYHPKKAEYHYKQAIGLFEKLAADSPSFHSYHAGLAESLSVRSGTVIVSQDACSSV
ncbi:MAG: serine/threonine protein kinase [Planctomycetota bacterium]|jgi:serine/threonine protein kinase